MAFREEDMYPYVWRNLRARYPRREGWEIRKKFRRNSYEIDFVVERKRSKKTQRVVVEVKATHKVLQDHISQLNRYARNVAGRKVKVINKILVVPAGADTSIVPPDIEVMYLRRFKIKR